MSKNYYFDEQAILDWQDSTSQSDKNKIYTNRIHKSFVKISKIFTRKFFNKSDTEIESACLVHLYNILNKFDRTRDHKAFSFFSVCARNFCLKELKKKAQKTSSYESLTDQRREDLYSNAYVTSPVERHIEQENLQQKLDIVNNLKPKLEKDQKFLQIVQNMLKNKVELTDGRRMKEILDEVRRLYGTDNINHRLLNLRQLYNKKMKQFINP